MSVLAEQFKRAFALYPTGVAIITCCGPDGCRFGITSGSFGALSLDPPLVAWSLRKQSRHLAPFLEADSFGVSTLGEPHADLATEFASQSDDKFARGEWMRSSLGDPLLVGAVSHFACKTEDRLDKGDHILFLGRVSEIECSGGAPVVYFDRSFCAIKVQA